MDIIKLKFNHNITPFLSIFYIILHYKFNQGTRSFILNTLYDYLTYQLMYSGGLGQGAPTKISQLLKLKLNIDLIGGKL